MSAKRWGIGLGVIGLMFFLGGPLLIAGASLFSAISAQLSSRTYDLGTGQQIRIKKTVTPQSNWATGGRSELIDYALFYKGTEVSPDDLQKWINANSPGLTQTPAIHDVYALAADEFLVMVDNVSQQSSYLVVHIHLNATRSAPQADVIRLGAEDSAYSWFPNSRATGWARAVTESGSQFMIRFSPLEVIPLGQGELAKVELPYAFLVSNAQKAPLIDFRVVDLRSGAIAASLSVDRDCFSLPQFSFNHPLLDARETTEEDQQVNYSYGPKWWDKNVEWTPGTTTLKLRPQHSLAAPAAKFLSVQYEPGTLVQSQSGMSAQASMPEKPFWVEGNEIDQVPVTAKDCLQQNPQGVKKARTSPAGSENIDVVAFCLLEEGPVDSAARTSACGVPTRTKSFSSNGVTVNDVSFLYHRLSEKASPIQIAVPEIESDGKKITSVNDPQTKQRLTIREVFSLNENQLLFKARSTGPWQAYLMGTHGTELTVDNIGSFAYPSGTFASIGNDGFLYDTRSGILVRKKPFGYLDRVPGLVDIRGQRAAAAFVDKGIMHVRVVQFTDASRMQEQPVSVLEIPASCVGEEETPDTEMNLSKRQQWFNKSFAWSPDNAKVSLKAPCRQR